MTSAKLLKKHKTQFGCFGPLGVTKGSKKETPLPNRARAETKLHHASLPKLNHEPSFKKFMTTCNRYKEN